MRIWSTFNTVSFRRPNDCPAEKTTECTASLGRVQPAEDAEKVPGGSIDCRTSEQPKPFGEEELIVNDGIAPPRQILFPPEKICMDWQQPLNVGVGLQNLGNMCYLNATLQCLTYTPPLANYMLSLEHSKSCHEKGFCMMCTLEAHINQVLRCSNCAMKPISVIDGLKRIGKHFHYGSQEDAHEFLSFTVDALQKACLNGSTTWDASSQATTLIYQIFGGYLRSQVKCLNCKAVSDRHEPFLNIALDIETATSVTEALEQFVKPEQLGGENSYKCSKCENMVSASKRYTIHRSPKVLTISLKRFADFTGGKINKDIKYPEYLDLRAYMSQSMGEPLIYSLYAVLVHSGFNCNAGHYICFIKAGNGFWYQMNDDIVERSDIKTVLNQQAYLLFYIRMCARQYRCSHDERNSPNNGKSSGKRSHYRSGSRERTEQDRNKYYYSKGERTWSRESYYEDEAQRQKKCRYDKDYDSAHGTGVGRERNCSRFDEDFDKLSQFSKSQRDAQCKSRWTHNAHSREERAHHLSSHKGNFHHCSVPQQQSEKHSWERHTPPPASAHAQFDKSFWGNEKLRLGKRKCGDTEGSESEMGKKYCKTDDKQDYKLQDLNGLVFRIDNDKRIRKQKKEHIRKQTSRDLWIHVSRRQHRRRGEYPFSQATLYVSNTETRAVNSLQGQEAFWGR